MIFNEIYIPVFKYSNSIISLDLGFVLVVALLILLATFFHQWLSTGKFF